MTLTDFSNGFDTLVSSYRRFRDFDKREPLDTIEFNEYEKSFFLTKAQEEIVLSLYNGKNTFGESFESTEELREYLSGLVVEVSLDPTQNSTGVLGIDSNSKFFTLPENTWFITYESVKVTDSDCGEKMMDVYPVTQDEYHKIRRNPFRGANKRRALRLNLADGVIEIVCQYTVTKYYLRYLKKLNPIILEAMPSGAAIYGMTEESECEVHEGLHHRILERAVQLALQSKGMGERTNDERNR